MRTMHKTKGKVKLPSLVSTASSSTETTVSAITLSEKDMNYLLKHLLKAMHLQTLNPNSTNMPTSSDTAGLAS